MTINPRDELEALGWEVVTDGWQGAVQEAVASGIPRGRILIVSTPSAARLSRHRAVLESLERHLGSPGRVIVVPLEACSELRKPAKGLCEELMIFDEFSSIQAEKPAKPKPHKKQRQNGWRSTAPWRR